MATYTAIALCKMCGVIPAILAREARCAPPVASLPALAHPLASSHRQRQRNVRRFDPRSGAGVPAPPETHPDQLPQLDHRERRRRSPLDPTANASPLDHDHRDCRWSATKGVRRPWTRARLSRMERTTGDPRSEPNIAAMVWRRPKPIFCSCEGWLAATHGGFSLLLYPRIFYFCSMKIEFRPSASCSIFGATMQLAHCVAIGAATAR